MATKTIAWSSNGYNGIINWLGENKDAAEAFTNPVDRGLLNGQLWDADITSVGIKAATNHSASTSGSSRIHTFSYEGSNCVFDFGEGNGVQPTRIGIQHQAHSDDQLRNFVIQGSVDGNGWDDLVVGVNDTTISGASSWGSWAVTATEHYRYIRIIVTGLNSSSARRLVFGEFEIWGEYSDELENPAATELVEIPFSAPGANGIFDWLGRGKDFIGAEANADTDYGFCTASQISIQLGIPADAFDRSVSTTGGRVHTTGGTTTDWWKVDMGEGSAITPYHFGLRGQGHTNDQPRNFIIQGSNNDSDWTTLATAVADGPGNGSWWDQASSDQATAWRYLRVQMTGDNSSGRDFLVFGEFEVWGMYNGAAGFKRSGSMMLLGVG